MKPARWIAAVAWALPLVLAGCGSSASAPSTVSAQGSESAPAVDVVKIVEQKLNSKIKLPGELSPYEVVDIYPKVTGFVQWLGVDRGSNVKRGEVIARLEAPELTAQLSEAQSRFAAAQAQASAAEAKLSADQSTYQKLDAASKTPGVVAPNDVYVARQTVESGQANVKSAESAAEAAKGALQSVKQIQSYLEITAPFDGVVSQRNVHPGALVGPSGGPGAATPILRIETVSRLRLTVPVPETQVEAIPAGAQVEFHVPAFPGDAFHAPIARISHAVELKTRTMAVELDVANPGGRFAAGSYCEVEWPLKRGAPTLFVPASAIATNLERTLVIRVNGSKAEWVDVKTGASWGNLTEVFGDLRAGDIVVERANDTIRSGVEVTPKLIPGAN